MPLYEYSCRGCKKRFEQLLFGSEKPVCPGCRGTDLERLLSTFAVGAPAVSFGSGAASEGAAPGGGCGSCGDPRGPGSCAID